MNLPYDPGLPQPFQMRLLFCNQKPVPADRAGERRTGAKIAWRCRATPKGGAGHSFLLKNGVHSHVTTAFRNRHHAKTNMIAVKIMSPPYAHAITIGVYT
jgi:hypothetical protein